MATPTVSIVMPVYGVKDYLEKAVRSILFQTFSDFELILIDDCSVDGSGIICDRLAETDCRIRVIHFEVNRGVSAARNEGISQAAGQYLMFLDSDDTVEPDMLTRAVSSMREHPAQVVIWGLTEEYYDNAGNIIKQIAVTYPEKKLDNAEQVHVEVFFLEQKDLYGYPWNKLYDCNFVRQSKVRFPEMPFNEDILFNAALFMQVEKCNILDMKGNHYAKRNSNSLTGRFIPNYYENSMKRVQALYDQYIAWHMKNPQALAIIAGRYVRYLFSALQRNCDSRMNLTHCERKQFLQTAFETDLHKNLKKSMQGRSLSGVMAFCLRSGQVWLCLSIARVIYVVKNKLPGLFLKANKAAE